MWARGRRVPHGGRGTPRPYARKGEGQRPLSRLVGVTVVLHVCERFEVGGGQTGLVGALEERALEAGRRWDGMGAGRDDAVGAARDLVAGFGGDGHSVALVGGRGAREAFLRVE